jgi:hypothetical protein
MDAPKGKPLCDLEGPRAGMLQGFSIGAGKQGKEAGRSPTVLPFGSPPRLRSPRGACIETAGELGLILTLKVQSHWPRRRIYAHKEGGDSAIAQLIRELQLDIELPVIPVWLSDLSTGRDVCVRPTCDRDRCRWL